MSICWYCKKQIPDAVKICPHCAADQTTPGTRPKVARRLEDLRRAQPATFMVMGEAARGRRRSLRGLWLVGLAVAIAITIWALIPTRFDSRGLEAFDDAPCVQYDRCVVVYLAAWSPAAIRTLDTMRSLAPTLADSGTGFGIIVGADDPDAVDALAGAAPVGGWIDRDDSVPGRMNIDTVPTWFLLDRSGKVLQRVDGTYFPLGYHRQKLGI